MRTRIYDFREAPPDLAPDRSTPPRRLGLHALVLALMASGILLYLLGGLPHLPVRPDARAIVDGLRSADPPLAGAASWCFALAWALWLWTVGSLLAQAAMVALERVTGGAAWVLALRPALAPFLMPLARRAFPVLTAGVIVIRLATSPTPGTAAAPAPIVLALPGAALSAGQAAVARVEEDSGPSEHLVVEGDTLWALAERYYGDGSLFSVLHEANLGRPMPDGTRYEGRLRPGQLLLVPPAATTVAAPEEQFVYTVARGDTLRAIAARFLGDEMRWPEIFALNRDVAALPDGRTLTDPDLIWPGLRLTIPAGPPAASPAPGVVSPAPPVALPSAPPSPSPSPSASPSPPPTPLPVVGTPAASTPTAVPTATTTPAPAPAATPAPASPVPPGRVATAVPPTPSAPIVAPPRPAAPPESPARLAPGRAPLVVGAGALGAAVAGGAIFLQRRQLLARRELRRRLRTAASPAVVIREVRMDVSPDFADGDLLGTFTHRAHGGEVEPAVALAHHAARFFAEEGLDRALPLLVAQGAHGDAWLLMGAPRAERDRVVALAPALGSLLGGGGRTLPVRATGDVEVRLTGLTAVGLLAPLAGPEESALPTVLPLAELPGATPLFANWDALGDVLVAGGPGEGTDIALTGLVATLASRRHPDTLRLWALAHPQALPPELFALPHWGDPRVDPEDRARVAGLLADLRAELDRRREELPGTARPELVLVLAEAADLLRRDDASDDTTLELLATDGPGHGIRIVAATARPEALDDGALRLFGTRLVLRLADEAQSVRLLGVPAATALPGGGRLLLRLAGRTPRPFAGAPPGSARGYRIAPEALAALAEQLRRTYGGETGSPGIPLPTPDDVSAITGDERAPLHMGNHVPADTQSPGEIEVGEVPTAGDLAGTAVRDASPIASTGMSQTAGSPASDAEDQAREQDTKAADEIGGAPLVAGSIRFASNDNELARHRPGEPSDDDEQREGRDPIVKVCPCRASDDDSPVHASEPPDHAAEVLEIAARNGKRIAGPPPETVRSGEGVPEDRISGLPTNGAGQAAQLTIAESTRGTVPTPALAPEEITADRLARDPGEEPPVATPLAIHCFGHFRVLHAGEHLAPQHHAKAWELLQLLAAHPPRSLTKDRLWSALWPDPDGWPTRNVFNTIVGRLRQELIGQVPDLPREVVQKTRAGDCWLDPDLVTVDVHRWLAILKQEPKLPLLEALGQYRLARALYRPALLEGASYEWLTLRDDGLTLAEEYAERWSDYRLRLARRCVREGRPDLAVPLYRGMVNEQPREEAFVRELLRCYGQTSDLPGLERQMRTLEAALREGYGDELDPHRIPSDDQPEAETRKVYSEVKVLLQAGLAESASASDK